LKCITPVCYIINENKNKNNPEAGSQRCEGAREERQGGGVMNQRLQRQRQKRRELRADEKIMLCKDSTFAGISKKIKEMRRSDYKVSRPTL
jgi:hypothetical protein